MNAWDSFDTVSMWNYLLWLETRPRHFRLPLEFTGGALLESWREFLQLNKDDPRALCLFVHVVYLMSFNAGYVFRQSLKR